MSRPAFNIAAHVYVCSSVSSIMICICTYIRTGTCTEMAARVASRDNQEVEGVGPKREAGCSLISNVECACLHDLFLPTVSAEDFS